MPFLAFLLLFTGPFLAQPDDGHDADDADGRDGTPTPYLRLPDTFHTLSAAVPITSAATPATYQGRPRATQGAIAAVSAIRFSHQGVRTVIGGTSQG